MRRMLAFLRCIRAILALLLALVIAAGWSCLPRGSRLARRVAAAGWSLLLAGFGVRLRRQGAPAEPQALVAANHVSWIDIVALGSALDAGFVAKAEVAAWPLIGPLARRYGCLFVARESRSAVLDLAAAMEGYPRDAGLVLFPEGTTDGTGLLPFRSSLFIAPSRRWPKVQPVTILYRDRRGQPLSPEALRRVAWIGDDALLPHAFALAAAGGVEVELWFEPTFVPADRKGAARRSREDIAARLDQAAALKRAA